MRENFYNLIARCTDQGSDLWSSALESSPFKKSLFNTKECSTNSLDSQKKSKLSIINKMLYNVTSLLGAVGAGFDVRESSVRCKMMDGSSVDSTETIKDKARPIHNTYHGVTRHVR